jgi:hypothetical protein
MYIKQDESFGCSKKTVLNGATTFSMTTFSIRTFSIRTFSIRTFSMMTFSIKINEI